jgi:hypothetical protein
MYAAPLMIAAILFLVGAKQRVPATWIVVALGAACILGGFHNIGVVWPDGIHPGELSASFMTLVGSAYWLWLRRESSRLAQ